jgi:catechol 2,3-dioxygenase-like lactoylglutathione lyase family enzyme
MPELPAPPEGIVLTHFIVSDDVERSKRFYTEVLCGRVAFGCGLVGEEDTVPRVVAAGDRAHR